ncbi:MAG: Na+/H+ antiporter subunit C [Anaerolineae bacterium]|nr:Na+/H+ antiporter subunit C [Anaerolineae bacterium]
MEALVSIALGVLAASGVYLILRPTTFSVVLGLTLLSYAVNALIFFGARLKSGAPPLSIPGLADQTDPLPQALVLTAIVIGFGMTAYLMALALKGKAESGTDHVDAGERK